MFGFYIAINIMICVVVFQKHVSRLDIIEEISNSKDVSDVIPQFHGINAFEGLALELCTKIDTCVSGVVICGANMALGDIGIEFEGVVFRAWKGDCFSTIESRNNTDTTSAVSLEVYKAAERSMSCGYIESHSVVDVITAIWYKKGKDKVVAEALAAQYNVLVKKVK